MSEVKKAPRSQRKGLVFSSTTSSNSQKRKRSASPSVSSPPPYSPSKKPKPTVTTRILILSDTHGHSTLPSALPPNPHLEAVIHCGDLSQSGSLADYRATLSILFSLPAQLKLVIPGNHDLSLCPPFRTPASNSHAPTTAERLSLSRAVRELWTGPEATGSGVLLLETGFHEFALRNGARLRVYATPWTPLPAGVDGGEWAFGNPSSQDIYNPPGTGVWYSTPSGTRKTLLPSSCKGVVDVFISHGPPRYRLDRTEEGESIGCKHLWRAVRRARPKLVAFGHVHNGYGCERVRWKVEEEGDLPKDDDVDDGIEGIEKVEGKAKEGGVRFVELEMGNRGEETFFINSALMGEAGLERMPWIVEMELERAGLRLEAKGEGND